MQLIKNFPIQVTTDRVLINNETELHNFVDKYNTKTTLYYSLYDVEKKQNKCNCGGQTEYHSCNTKNLNKICFDIDNLNALSIIKKMHLYLLNHNLKHLILFSGEKGFHLYIFTQNYFNIKNPKNTLLNSHNYFIKEFNLKNGIDVDNHIIGDINRLMRIPNTQHLNSKLYCIPITTEDLVLGKNHIMNKAKQQNFDFTYYGDKLLDIKQFDNGIIDYIHPKHEFGDMNSVAISIDKKVLLNEMPSCLQNILLMPYVYWRLRFYVLKYLLDNGYGDNEIDAIMKTFLEGKNHPIHSHDNYEHYNKERQLQYVKRNKALFSCQKIKQDGLCNENYCKIIREKPIYL